MWFCLQFRRAYRVGQGRQATEELTSLVNLMEQANLWWEKNKFSQVHAKAYCQLCGSVNKMVEAGVTKMWQMYEFDFY